MRSFLTGQQRAGQCDLLKWKVSPSFSGKPHLRCQTTPTQCWKMKILEGVRCIHMSNFFISGYLLFTVKQLGPKAAVSCAIPDLYPLKGSQIRRRQTDVSQWWLSCSPSSAGLSVQPLIERQGDGRNQSALIGSPVMTAFPYFPIT